MEIIPHRKIVAHPAVLAGILIALFAVCSVGANEERLAHGDWVEEKFPFFSSVLDARKAGLLSPSDNLTPRGLILKLGGGNWACFDVDLLRVSAVWRGAGVTPVGLAPGSYHVPDRKTPLGQNRLPVPDGTVWVANGIYPGWQTGETLSLSDPREPAPMPAEVGRGALPEKAGRFLAVQIAADSVTLEYEIAGTVVWEHMRARPEDGTYERHFLVGASANPMLLILGTKGPASAAPAISGPSGVAILENAEVWVVSIPPHSEKIEFATAMSATGQPPPAASKFPLSGPGARWKETILTEVREAETGGAYVVDDVELPESNPWKRAVRISDIQFLKDGTGVGVTIDGDVWLVRGLALRGERIAWNRFASGLHEPMSLAIRDDEIFVFDRNGIWRLKDTNGDGEADRHELFSNTFAQTADTREFASTIRLAPDRGFVIAKGGQEGQTFGKHNGSVLRISADGIKAEILGYGFRQPFIGVDPKTGLVTASDQQGHYVPSTPIHIVRGGQFYGFLSHLKPREQYPAPIADPLTWIPHTMNPSGISQVWLRGAKMGPLNDALVHVSFNRPEIFRIMLNERGGRMQAAVVGITGKFDFAPLNASVNPADGQLYVAGFQVLGWGTTATRISGLARVRYTGAESLLANAVVPMDKGALLSFDTAIDPESLLSADAFSAGSWHYKRTFKYGSPQLKSDETPGIDQLPVSRAYISEDRKSVFVAIPDMKPVMQMQIEWRIRTASGEPMRGSTAFTPYELAVFEPHIEGFGDISVDLTPRAVAGGDTSPASAQEGRAVAERMGCAACHSTTDKTINTPGPSWLGLFGSTRQLSDGRSVLADEAYLRESILDPGAKIATGHDKGEFAMPTYAGVLTEQQIESIVLYIRELAEEAKQQ